MSSIRRWVALLAFPLLVAAGLASVTVLNSSASAAVTCTTTITGAHPTQLTVTSGVTCLVNATQNGNVTVDAGAGLSVTNSKVNGLVTATGASSITYCGSTQSGTMNITGTTGAVTLGDGGSCAADTIPSLITISGAVGPVDINGLTENGTLTLSGNTGGITVNGISLSGIANVQNNTGAGAIVISGNTINGSLNCSGNTPAPVDNGTVNIVSGTGSGQCAAISSRTPVTHTAPVLANIETTPLAYTAGSGPVQITATLTVSSADATTLAGATVTISAGLVAAEDSLGFTSQNGITGSYNASTGVLTLTGTASLANYQAALRSVTYTDSNAHAATSARTITFQVNDGSASNHLSNTASRTIDVSAPAVTPPVISNVETTPLDYTSGSAPVAVTSTLTISDGDATSLTGGTVSITAGFDSGADSLGFTSQNGITGSYDAATGVLTLTGTASVADYQAALRSVTFATTDASASPAARTVSFAVTDTNSETSNTASRTIEVAAAATAPTAVNQSYNDVGNTTLAVGTTPTGPAATYTAGDGLLNGDSGDASCGTLTVTGTTTAADGTVTANANGTFTYLPAADFIGTDTFQYTITCGTSGKTATATVTITVSTLVWYVNNAAGSAGNGESSSPFNTLAAANTALGANSIVFLYQGSGTYTGGLTMKSGDSLLGQPHGLTVGGFALVAAGGSNPVITNAGGDAVDLGNGADVEDVNVSNPSGDGFNGQGVSGTITITGSTMNGTGGDGIDIAPAAGATTTLTITNNSVQTTAPVFGIDVDPDGGSTLTGTATGTISGNTIGSASVANSGAGIGINAQDEGSFTLTLAITNNKTFQYQNDSGINFESDKGSPALNLTITGNTVADPGSFGSWGILGDAGAETGDSGTVCADISGNSVAGSAAAGQGGADIELDQEFDTTIELPGYTGGAQATSAVAALLAGQNTGNGTPSVIATTSGSGGGFVGGSACATP
jgi:Cadherin-like domain